MRCRQPRLQSFDVSIAYRLLHRRKQREAKKYGKQVAAEVRKERTASKKANVDAMTKLRKQRAKRCLLLACPIALSSMPLCLVLPVLSVD